jgi:chemotaxis protein histidine kinase CheA
LTGTHPVLPILPAREPASVAFADTADPELLKLFIEEAREELQKITRYFHDWEQNPLDREALTTVRRSFHTLKGSGRMVGARELAEFAWSIENLVNRLLDNTLSRTQPIVATLASAVTTLPQLIDQLETGQAHTHDAGSILTRANALAANQADEPPAAPSPPEEPPEPGVAQSADIAAPQAEPAAPAAPQVPEPVAIQRGRRARRHLCARDERPRLDRARVSGARRQRLRHRTCCPRKSIAPFIRSPAAPTWLRRAMASGSPSRSISGCARHLTAGSAWRAATSFCWRT